MRHAGIAIGILVLGPCGVKHGDGRDDGFPKGGKDDSNAIVDGAPDAVRALRVGNAMGRDALESDVGLTADAAENLAARRSGADGALDARDSVDGDGGLRGRGASRRGACLSRAVGQRRRKIVRNPDLHVGPLFVDRPALFEAAVVGLEAP